MSTIDFFQGAVACWLQKCFGSERMKDVGHRTHRFLEEALELGQSLGCTKQEALQLVDYVYGRPAGDPDQETGGVAITLSAICTARDVALNKLAWAEHDRVWTKIDNIRAKDQAKPEFSPLPGSSEPAEEPYQWWYSLDQERWFPASSREDAIELGNDEADAERFGLFWVCEANLVKLHDNFFDADRLIEQFEEHNEEGFDIDYGPQVTVSADAKEELEQVMTRTFSTWRAKHNHWTAWSFDKTRNEETINVELPPE